MVAEAFLAMAAFLVVVLYGGGAGVGCRCVVGK
jgi:hypothetical protein